VTGPARSAALLRGINVSGHRKVPMAELRQLVAGLGAVDVETYLQSGNVVFGAADPLALGRALEVELAEQLDVDVHVVVRSADQLAAVVAGQPFEGTPTQLHVTFLAAEPAAERAAALETGRDDDRCALVGREVYLLCPDGYGRTKLNNAFFERRLQQAATTRNWRTVLTLAEMTAGA